MVRFPFAGHIDPVQLDVVRQVSGLIIIVTMQASMAPNAYQINVSTAACNP